MRGWQVPAYPFTELAHKAFQRILVKRGFTREMATLLTDIKDAIAYLSLDNKKADSSPAQQASYNHL